MASCRWRVAACRGGSPFPADNLLVTTRNTPPPMRAICFSLPWSPCARLTPPSVAPLAAPAAGRCCSGRSPELGESRRWGARLVERAHVARDELKRCDRDSPRRHGAHLWERGNPSRTRQDVGTRPRPGAPGCARQVGHEPAVEPAHAALPQHGARDARDAGKRAGALHMHAAAQHLRGNPKRGPQRSAPLRPPHAQRRRARSAAAPRAGR